MTQFYFHDMKGNELNSELQGSTFESAGSSIAIKNNEGYFIKSHRTLKGLLFSREVISFVSNPMEYEGFEIKNITIENFPGHDSVMVLECDHNYNVWFLLTSKQPGEFMASDVALKSSKRDCNGEFFDYK